MATTELVFRIKTEAADFKSTMAQVRAELNQTGKTQSTVGKGELSMRQQLAAASSLQRQRSAALIGEWKKTETAAKQLATGVLPVSTNIQKITDTMQTLARSTATLQGPLGGVAGRLSSMGATAGEAAGSLGVLGVAVGAAAVALVGLGVAIYKITVATADFQGKMFDLSQQVGVNVETLSTLEIVAQTTGGSIDQIAQSIFIFQQKLEDAQDPASKTAKVFKDLGVETNNTEDAFRQALAAIAKMPEGFQQSDTAAQLFGSRGGKQVLAVLKEMDGDLDATTERFRKMGILITTDVAAAADKFNDQLAVLGFQMRGAAAIIGNEAMPIILSAIESLSRVLVDNQDHMNAWVRELSDAAAGAAFLGSRVSGLIPFLRDLGSIMPNSGSVLDALIKATPIGGAIGALATAERLRQGPFGGVTSGASGIGPTGRRTPTGTGGRGGGRAARDTALQDATKEAALASREALHLIEVEVTENKRALDEQVRSIEEFTRRAIEIEQQRLDATIDRISAESNALEEALAKKTIKQSEYEIKQRELDLDAAEAHQKFKDDSFNKERDQDHQISEARIAAKKRELQIAEEADQRQIDRIQDRIDRGLLLESEGEREIAAIVAEGFERRKKVLEEEEAAYSTTLERRADINAELIRQEGERADATVKASQRIIDAWNREQAAKAGRGAEGATRGRRAVDPILEKGPFQSLSEELTNAGVLSKQTADIIGGTLAGAFADLSGAVGQAVQSFVLFGKVEGGFRKFAAELIASLAASAAVQAVYQLAQGLAWLALNFFFPNPQYAKAAATAFASAAVFGSLAGVATLAGRALAGNSFAPAGGGGGQGAPGSGPTEERDRTIRERRTGGAADPNQPIIHVTLAARTEPGVMVEHIKTEYKRGGGLRDLFRQDLLGEATG